jgi:hypothetical protein
MTAQPIDPADNPDTGSYEVIHLGGHAAVVVPVADSLRLRALERSASEEALHGAEDAVALQQWRSREANGEASYVGAEQVRRRLGLPR